MADFFRRFNAMSSIIYLLAMTDMTVRVLSSTFDFSGNFSVQILLRNQDSEHLVN